MGCVCVGRSRTVIENPENNEQSCFFLKEVQLLLGIYSRGTAEKGGKFSTEVLQTTVIGGTSPLLVVQAFTIVQVMHLYTLS